MYTAAPHRTHATRPRLTANLTRGAMATAVALALAIGGGVAAQSAMPPAATPGAAAVVAPAMPSFADVAERVSPAVVNVTVVAEGAPEQSFGPQGLPDGAPMEEFFKRFFEQPGMPHGRPGGHRAEGAGSGFIIDPTGLVVTNNHVVDGANEITVTLNDGSKHKAKVLGRDEKTDLALLKIEAGHPLPAVDLTESKSARVGDWVLAVGNPFGLGGTVTAGIVSARGRDIHAGPYDDYIQIDAPINRGNSGGPLFDAYGRVIGVNTAIYSPTGGSVGIGFAIPAETVKSVVAELRAEGRVERGWLGLQIQPVTEDMAAAMGLNGTAGVLVADVLPDGPAAGTNIKAGDVILKAGGQTIKDYKDLPKLIAATKAGTEIAVELVRSGQPETVKVKVGTMPSDESLAKDEGQGAGDQAKAQLGLRLAPLTPELRQQLGLAPGSRGVYVAQVQPGSPADEAGITAGCLISMVGGAPVSTPTQAVEAIRAAAATKRSAVMLRVEKDGRPMFIAIPFAA
ncbi:DegQ family serine endoprotease [uncultured Thiodictyon sp.]|uniref:DegQ family serine endoprotease n=1 Tax=uncultured Thiodictyon sp. TaxID=1846217 RepID=UPI0025D780C2|nr:DegQ family serine endoprotease [uncultured Thiodictyon sp.]